MSYSESHRTKEKQQTANTRYIQLPAAGATQTTVYSVNR